MSTGIDWGNTNTVVAFKAGRREHLFEMGGDPCIPSYMQYNENGDLVAIGRQAKNALRMGEGQVIAGLKRLIGAAFDDELEQWAEDVYGLNLRAGETGGVLVQVGHQWKSPEEMAVEYFRMLLALLRNTARETGGWLARLFESVHVEQCVVTCPVQYLNTQKAALQDCLAKAGFQLKENRLLPEPTAVCRLLPGKKPRNTLIVDWGGGTLDFAFKPADGECRRLSAVQSHCGGIDMDHAILKALQQRGELSTQMEPLDRFVAREFVERRKERVLSNDGQIPPDEGRLPSHGIGLTLTFQREDVAKWIDPICTRAQNATAQTLYMHDLNVERCVLVGGPFCSDYVRGKICEVLDKDCEVVLPEGSPMTAVATGACREFAAKDGQVVTPVHDYGVMVDLLDWKLGLLLLRGEQTCPVTSDARSFRLSGDAARTVDITVFARKKNPATQAATYETSSTFQFLPRFHNGQARISVMLEADASGAISARVTDEATQREMRLHGVGKGIAKSMKGPPARTMSEETGLWLLHCWRAHLVSMDPFALLSGSNAGEDVASLKQLESFVNTWIDEHKPPETPEEIWMRAVPLARAMLTCGLQIDDRESGLDEVLKAVDTRLRTTASATVDEGVVHGLLRLLDDLLMLLVRAFGDQVLAPELAQCASLGDGRRVRRTLDSLLRLLADFQGSTDEYQTLVLRISEARNDLEREIPETPALVTLGQMGELVSARGSMYSQLQQLWSFLRNLAGRDQ